MDNKRIRQLLRRYLLGQAAESDNNAVDNWYRSFDSGDPVRLSEEEASAAREEIWDAIYARLPKKERPIRHLPTYARVAAMIVLIAGAAVVVTLMLRHRPGPLPMAFTTVSTGIGEKRTVMIPDGSRLVLDAGTTIRIQNDLSINRKVEVVDGQVFFDVRTDARRPFVIASGGLTTTVLGTSFTVSAYSALSHIGIGVVSGKVSVARDTAVLGVLQKDQELLFNKSDRKYKMIPLDESLTAWRNGRLIFNDLAFDEMAELMKKNFGVKVITGEDSIKHTRYTTELDTAMTPLAAAQVLAAIHDLKVTIKDSTIFFHQ